MKLISVNLHGYKRFAQPSTMNVDGKLIAVVGPNESGKTSFLHALEHLNDLEPFSTSGGAQETTRNLPIPDNQVIVEARYLLDDADREALGDISGAKEARWFTLGKRIEGGTFWCNVTPRPRRSLEPRQRVVDLLNQTGSRQGFLELVEQQEEPDELRGQIESLTSNLDTTVDTLSEAKLQEIRNVAETLENAATSEGPKYVLDLARRLYRLADYETGNPHLDSINILADRRPRFLRFRDEERLLQSEYSLDEVSEEPPGALRNLARLAQLDLETLYGAITANDYSRVESMEEQANDNLRTFFHQAWYQSEIAPRFRIDGLTLHVLVREPQARYTSRTYARTI